MEYIVRVPRLFYDDHMARLGDDEALWEVQKQGARVVTVRMDRAGYTSLLGDAEFYADTRNHDAGWPALVASARRTVAACKAAA